MTRNSTKVTQELPGSFWEPTGNGPSPWVTRGLTVSKSGIHRKTYLPLSNLETYWKWPAFHPKWPGTNRKWPGAHRKWSLSSSDPRTHREYLSLSDLWKLTGSDRKLTRSGRKLIASDRKLTISNSGTHRKWSETHRKWPLAHGKWPGTQ